MRCSSGRLIIQPDWNTALNEDGKIWISYKKTGSNSVHGEIKITSRSASGEPTFNCTENFSVHQYLGSQIVVEYSHLETYCMARFLAPVVKYSAIHPQRKGVCSLDVHAGGLAVSADTSGNLFVWESESGEIRRKLEGHVGDVYSCKLFPSGIVVLSGGMDMMIKIWSAETGKCAVTMIGHRAAINDFSIIDRGRNIVSCSNDGTAKLWECGTQQCLVTLENLNIGALNACSLSSTGEGSENAGVDGKIIALAGENAAMTVCNIQSREQVFTVKCDSAVNCCSFIDNTQLVCGTQNGSLYYFDTRNPAHPVHVLNEGRAAVLSVTPSCNGLIMSTADGSCVSVKNNFSLGMEYTGSDCDPIYETVESGNYIYTACRDGIIRKYSHQ